VTSKERHHHNKATRQTTDPTEPGQAECCQLESRSGKCASASALDRSGITGNDDDDDAMFAFNDAFGSEATRSIPEGNGSKEYCGGAVTCLFSCSPDLLTCILAQFRYGDEGDGI
jgi:hypothetical protein